MRRSRKYLVLTAIVLAAAAGAAAGAWALFFRPIQVQVSHLERDVPVQVFGLGTVEARIATS